MDVSKDTFIPFLQAAVLATHLMLLLLLGVHLVNAFSTGTASLVEWQVIQPPLFPGWERHIDGRMVHPVSVVEPVRLTVVRQHTLVAPLQQLNVLLVNSCTKQAMSSLPTRHYISTKQE